MRPHESSIVNCSAVLHSLHHRTQAYECRRTHLLSELVLHNLASGGRAVNHFLHGQLA